MPGEAPHPSAHAFILAGGRGTRFWPLSRRQRPKQLLDFTGEGPLLALTVDRLRNVVPPERQWVITSASLVDAVRDAAPEIPAEQIIGEPVGRNTAPAVGLAAALVERSDPRAPFLVLPSDHLIHPLDVFTASLRGALQSVEAAPVLLTFGIRPDRPETGYGYIEAGNARPDQPAVRQVVAFREKPDRDTARAYVDGGRHWWNSGMFAWTAQTVLDGLGEHFPEGVAPMREAASHFGTSEFTSALERAYESVPSISIDFALMEKAANVGVTLADFQWNDVGHWLAMRSLWETDADDNAVWGDVLSLESEDNIVFGQGRLTALLGVKNLVVVQTADATLICSTDQTQNVGRVVENLEQQGKTDLL